MRVLVSLFALPLFFVTMALGSERFKPCDGKTQQEIPACPEKRVAELNKFFNAPIDRCIPLAEGGELIFGRFTRHAANTHSGPLMLTPKGQISEIKIKELPKALPGRATFPLTTPVGVFNWSGENSKVGTLSSDRPGFKPLVYEGLMGNRMSFIDLIAGQNNMFYVIEHYEGDFSESFYLKRYLADGNPDPAYYGASNSGYFKAAVLRDNSVIVFGEDTYTPAPHILFVNKIKPDGTFDSQFKETLGNAIGNLPSAIHQLANDSLILQGVQSMGGTAAHGWGTVKGKAFKPGQSAKSCIHDSRLSIKRLAACDNHYEIETDCGSEECCGSETLHLITISNTGALLNFETRSFEPGE